MTYDQNTRNRLQKFVNEARDLLNLEFTRQFQQKYGLDAGSGEVSELERLVHLDDREMETARMLRDTLVHYLASSPFGDKRECLERMIREQAFTVLNRLCALRMAEAREIIIESLSRAYNSKGFQLYAHLVGSALGETGDAYRAYLFSLFDELALDLPVLFDRFSPQGRLFPGEKVLRDLLAMMNEPDIEPLWVEDETIGWIYQYFNTQEERRQMRSESQAPRNSRELAVRNQFFTPRYVVEFLSDNTLGRIWYEMTRGKTRLVDSCRYLVRRPQEIFLIAGEEAPEMKESAEDLSQEELLQQLVYIPHRPLKDPREIFMLDPACGSMHFGLYAFDLYEKIYEEAWDLESQLGHQAFERSENLKPLQQTYTNREEFLNDVPRLIVECNIHGVDIDSRAVQIAGLSLWLRAQRSWQCQGLKLQKRPQIRKSNVVCAEPMPGEKAMQEEFAGKLKPRVLGQLVEIIFEKMQLAGEAGSLLKIEEEIEEALNLAREEFRKEIQFRNGEKNTLFPDIVPPRQQGVFDFTDLGDKTRFWNFAEQKLLDALREYAEEAKDSVAAQKRLFAEDVARGFAFINLFQKRYDVVLMNPPFGDYPKRIRELAKDHYLKGWIDIYCCFIIRANELINESGLCGCITSRTFLFLNRLTSFRSDFILRKFLPIVIMDLGVGVMDLATVETCASVFLSSSNNPITVFFDVQSKEEKFTLVNEGLNDWYNMQINWKVVYIPSFKLLPDMVFAYQIDNTMVRQYRSKKQFIHFAKASPGLTTLDNERFIRLHWEVRNGNFDWLPFSKGGSGPRFYQEMSLVLLWKENGKQLKERAALYGGSVSRFIASEKNYFRPGLTYPRVGQEFSVRILPRGCVFAEKGISIFVNESTFTPEETNDKLMLLAGLLNSEVISQFISINSPGRFWEAGSLNRIPMPEKIGSSNLTNYAIEGYLIARGRFLSRETSRLFYTPDYRFNYHKSIDDVLINCNDEVKTLYGIKELVFKEAPNNKCFQDEDINDNISQISDWLSYIIGCLFARWDIRMILDSSLIPKLPDPFAPLPVCPPGMLQNDQGLPASLQDVPDDYPLRISWNGILVDDEGQSEDIVSRVREAIEVIWEEKAGDIEQEACEILGVDSLRDYFRKPANFFAEHLKRYSKSRRQAPIYWPLSTASGSYTLWLYYHRLTDQTLYRCVNDYVEPKLKQVMESTRQLRQKRGRSRQEERELEELVNLEQELQEFRDALLRVAVLWKPDLNDGVQITAAPLWKLFRLTNWRNKLKQTWEKLEKGDYDWAHLAYSIWPERVKEKCKNDKSLAIAHDLEGIYEEPITRARKKGGRGKKNT